MTESGWNVDYLTRLTRAEAALEFRIREKIPSGVAVKDRTSKRQVVHPGAPGYQALLRRFVEDVSGERARTLLKFLYQFDKYLSRDIESFKNQYKERFATKPEQWAAVVFDYPKINQTTIATILATLSDTLLAYRLEDLEQLGLVERSTLKPPKPKYVRITPLGLDAVEAAIADGIDHLFPAFEDLRLAQQRKTSASR